MVEYVIFPMYIEPVIRHRDVTPGDGNTALFLYFTKRIAGTHFINTLRDSQ